MQIFIKTFNNTMTLEVEDTATVMSIKQQMQMRDGIAPNEHRLAFGGKSMVDTESLSRYGVANESTLTQLMDLPGGHCQVPCGIFDDPKLVAEIKEQAATIRKAIIQINELHSKTDANSFNQKTRWVMTKEEHCGKIITSIGEYCLCQRVKPVGAPGSPFKTEKDFIDALKSHHNVLVAAMKAKQSVNLTAADGLDHAVADWGKMYLPL
jgi:small subunit ribosomal protein S27Ae